MVAHIDRGGDIDMKNLHMWNSFFWKLKKQVAEWPLEQAGVSSPPFLISHEDGPSLKACSSYRHVM